MNDEQLSDEQFLNVDIDALVESTAGGIKKIHSRKKGNPNGEGLASKRKSVTDMPIVLHKNLPNKKVKTNVFGGINNIHVLSESSDEGDDEIEEWNGGDDIRSRNKGKGQKGSLALHTGTRGISTKKISHLDIDLTGHEKDTSSGDEEDVPVSRAAPSHGNDEEKMWQLSRRQKAELREWLYAFRKRFYNYWVVLNNNSVHVRVVQRFLSLL